MLLNFFDNVLDKIYYATRRPVATGSNISIALIVTLVSFCLAIFCFYKVVNKKNDKKPLNWGWLLLSIIMLAVCIAYSFQAVKSF